MLPSMALRVVNDQRFGDAHTILHDLLGSSLVERGGARGRAGTGERNAARFHQALHAAVFSLAAVKRQEKDRLVDRQHVERHLQVGPDGRPRRLEVVGKWFLVRQKLVAIHVVHRAARRPEPRQRRAERPHDVLRRGDGYVPLIAAATEEDDDGHGGCSGSRGLAVCWVAGLLGCWVCKRQQTTSAT